MRLTRGKAIIIAIFVTVGLTFLGLYLFEQTETGEVSPEVEVMLENVKMKRIDVENPDLMIVQVDLAIFNNTTQTLALSRIGYDLYANEQFIGKGNLSLEDIPLTGRAPLFPGSSTMFSTDMQFRKSPDLEEIWDKLRNDNTEGITWRAEGVAQVETAFSIIEKDFETTL